MPFYSTQVIIPTVDNVAANYATNSFTFEADDLTALQLAHTALVGFYFSMTTSMSALVRQTGWMIKSYDRSDPEPRAPALEQTFSLAGTPSGNPAPPELTLCLSFQGERVSGVPQAQKRGRIYFPFVDVSTIGTDGRPTSGLISSLASAGEDLLDDSSAAATWTWLVYSAVAPGYTIITNGWVDNEFDIQRRRGRPYTSRSVFV